MFCIISNSKYCKLTTGDYGSPKTRTEQKEETKSCRSVVSKRLRKRPLAVMRESLGFIADLLCVNDKSHTGFHC
jgi:hypothetical protein